MKPVDLKLSWEYNESDGSEGPDPACEATVIWRRLPYCGMVDVEKRALEILTGLNEFAQERCEGDPAAVRLLKRG